MTNSPKGFTLTNTNSCRLKFTRRFLKSLTEIKSRQTNRNNLSSSSSSSFSSSCIGEIRKSSQRIKLAAYSSMAHVVGPRKAWTRALLLKLHNRAKRRRFMKKTSLLGVKKKRVNKANRTNRCRPCEREIVVDKTEKLREIVPGGKAMDICSLLEETAHFINCLAMQVQVMQEITDQLSK